MLLFDATARVFKTPPICSNKLKIYDSESIDKNKNFNDFKFEGHKSILTFCMSMAKEHRTVYLNFMIRSGGVCLCFSRYTLRCIFQSGRTITLLVYE